MKKLKQLLGILLVMLVASTAQAAPPEAEAGTNADKNVEISIAPYGWLMGLKGTVGARGVKTEVDASFGDLTNQLDFAAMLAAEVVFYNKFGLTSNFNKTILSDQKSHNGISLSGETSLFIADIEAFYRIGSIPLGQAKTPFINFDLLAGARIWDVGLELDLDTRYLGSHNASRNKTWVDPLVGARAILQIDDNWRFVVQGDVGGGGNTSNTWDTTAFVGYTFWEHGTAMAGYRALGINRREGSGADRFVMDVTFQGPILGVIFTF